MIREISSPEIKALLVEMLRDIHSFCQCNGITYSIAYGTMLGAVRHKGFIPWDDDIDIMLPREHYIKFITTYSNERYKIVNYKNNKDYSQPYAKVYDTRTIIDEDNRYDAKIGVFIDIFPIDHIPDDKIIRDRFFAKKIILNFLHTLKTVSIDWNHRSLTKNILLLFGCFFLKPVSSKFICEKLDKLSQKYNKVPTLSSSVFVVTDNRKTEVFPTSLFVNTILLSFESIKVSAVSQYDKYLTGCYGNYMKLPPIDKQISNHSIKAWWKE